MNRRRFVQSALAATSALSWSRVRSAATTRPQRILVLGGTNFVGPAIVEQALEQGHEVSLFNRGITRPELFPQIEKIRGDRRAGHSGLAALIGKREWDAVVDVWPAEVGLVESTARVLKDRVGYYCFVSSVAVYDSFGRKGLTESDPVRWSDAGYGGEKARCERLLAELFPDRSSAVRCHSIFGPRDPGSSLHYWLRSLAHNARQIAPGPGDDPVQFVDVRDVAAWVVGSISEQRTGPWNLAGEPITFRAFVDGARRACESQAKVEWADAEFLLAQGVGVFTELPLWIPVRQDPEPGFFQISSDKARSSGFAARKIDVTLRDAWRWYQSAFFNDTTFPQNGWGMSAPRHDALLERLKTSQEGASDPVAAAPDG